MPATMLTSVSLPASAIASTIKDVSFTSAKSGVMSLKLTPFFGKSGMVLMRRATLSSSMAKKVRGDIQEQK